jgi:hypothetical protein
VLFCTYDLLISGSKAAGPKVAAGKENAPAAAAARAPAGTPGTPAPGTHTGALTPPAALQQLHAALGAAAGGALGQAHAALTPLPTPLTPGAAGAKGSATPQQDEFGGGCCRLRLQAVHSAPLRRSLGCTGCCGPGLTTSCSSCCCCYLSYSGKHCCSWLTRAVLRACRRPGQQAALHR